MRKEKKVEMLKFQGREISLVVITINIFKRKKKKKTHKTKRIRMPDAKEQPVCLTHWRNCFRTTHPWENMTLTILPRSVKPMVIC